MALEEIGVCRLGRVVVLIKGAPQCFSGWLLAGREEDGSVVPMGKTGMGRRVHGSPADRTPVDVKEALTRFCRDVRGNGYCG